MGENSPSDTGVGGAASNAEPALVSGLTAEGVGIGKLKYMKGSNFKL
jgi:hypothetical protein